MGQPNLHLTDMSIYEASDYWDEHDISEFDDVLEVKDLPGHQKGCGIDGVWNYYSSCTGRLY